MNVQNIKLQIGRFLKLLNQDSYESFRIVETRECFQTTKAVVMHCEVMIDGVAFDLVLPVAPEPKVSLTASR